MKHAEAHEALNELPSICQTVGVLGWALRRCKPGSKRHQRYWDRLTKLENQRNRMVTRIRLALESP